MDTKSLLYGIVGFILGGLLVSVAATTFDKPVSKNGDMTMNQMTSSLSGKTGDDFDKAFISEMIQHHQGAVDMAKQAVGSAKHAEVKQLSTDIIAAQEKEITQMKKWQQAWGYTSSNSASHSHDMAQ